jgi:hypothetical protein
MLKREDLRGISKITLIILILLIVLILVAFFVVKNIILKGSGERALGKFTLDLKISQVQIIQNNSLNVLVKRNKGAGEFTGINFIVDDGKNTERIQTNASLEELESRSFILPLLQINSSDVKKVSIDIVFKYESEKDFGQNIKDEYFMNFSDSNSISCIPYCPAGAQCGDNGCKGECASGCTQNGYVCSNYKCFATLATKCSQANITVTGVTNVETNFSVTLSRQGGEDDLGGVIFAFTNESGSPNYVTDIPGNIIPSSTATRYVTISEDHLENPSKVRIIVYFLDENKAQQFCQPSPQLLF